MNVILADGNLTGSDRRKKNNTKDSTETIITIKGSEYIGQHTFVIWTLTCSHTSKYYFKTWMPVSNCQ